MGLPSACSGDMYATVPRMCPSCVSSDSDWYRRHFGGNRVRSFRESEIENLHAGRRNHYVAGFQIAVDDALGVRCLERFHDLGAVGQRAIQWQRSSFEHCRERFALHVFHDEIRRAVLFADIVKAANVGIVQSGDRPRFTLESVPKVALRGVLVADQFDGDSSSKPRIADSENLTHPSFAQNGFDLVRADLCAKHKLRVSTIGLFHDMRADYTSDRLSRRVPNMTRL